MDFQLKSSKCVRECCRSDRIQLFIPKSSIQLNGEIAHGAESVVYEALLNDSSIVAAKKPRLSTADDLDRFHSELQIVSKLQHPNISKLLAAHAHPPNYLFVYRRYENGNLSQALHVAEWSFSTEKMLKMAIQLASALQYLHSLGIVHRDVKPANVLLDKNFDAHLSDFGLAAYARDLEKPASSNWKSRGKPTGGFHKKNMVGTLLYMAPEVLRKELQTEKSDVYAFGITINELFTGVVPYTDRRTEAQAHTVLEMNYTEQQLSSAVTSEGLRPVLATEEQGCPLKLATLIEQCWHPDPSQRPSFDSVLERLGKILSAVGRTETEHIVVKNASMKFVQDVDWGCRAEEYGNQAKDFPSDFLLPGGGHSSVPSLSWGVFSTRGGRQTMEDRHFLLPNIAGTGHIHAFGIFDGHRGYEAAEFSSRAVPRFLSAASVTRPTETLISAFTKTDAAFRFEIETEKSLQRKPDWNPGCTATTILFVSEHIFVANAGDCRTVLCRNGQAIALSKDHTASDEAERERILRSGGGAKWQVDSWRVGAPGLQVTRSIGDNDLKPGVTAEPEVADISISPNDDFLVMATDGLWDVVTNQRAVSLVKDTVKDPGLCAKRLATEAVERGSKDNITVIVIFLRPVSTVERIY